MNSRIACLAAAFLTLFSACEFGASPGGGTGVDGLAGTLVDASGAPAANAKVRIYPEASGPLPETSLSKSAQDVALMPESTITDAKGRFRFRGLSAGRYNLEASITRQDTLFSIFIPGIEFVKALDLGVNTLQVSGSLTVQVRTAAGAVVGVTCSLAGTSRTAVSDASGSCTFSVVAPGTYHVSTTFEGRAFTTPRLTVTPGLATGGALDVVPAGAVGGTQIPSNWILAHAQGYAFYMPPDMAFQGESQEVDAWYAQYASNRIELSLVAGYGTLTRPAFPGYFEETFVLDSNSSAFYRTHRDQEGRLQVILEVERNRPGMMAFFLVFTATSASAGDSLPMAQMLKSVQVWKGPGPAPVTPPPVPQLQYPAAAAIGISVTPALSWSSAAGTGSTDHYRLQVSSDSLFNTLLVNDSLKSPTSQTAVLTRIVQPALEGAKRHFWRVIGVGPGGTTVSETRDFTTHHVWALAAPTSPPEGAAGIAWSPTLTWTSYSPGTAVAVALPVTHRLQVSTDSVFSTFAVNDSFPVVASNSPLGGQRWTVGPLSPATKYYWRVLTFAKAEVVGAIYGRTQSFTTRAQTADAPPIVPQLGAPSNGEIVMSNSDSATFSWTTWNGVATTSYYHLQVATDDSFLDPVLNDTLRAQNRETGISTYKVPLKRGKEYYWRVVGVGNGGVTPSVTRTLTLSVFLED